MALSKVSKYVYEYQSEIAQRQMNRQYLKKYVGTVSLTNGNDLFADDRHVRETNRIYDGVEVKTRKSQASFQII